MASLARFQSCVLDLFNADQMQLASEDKHLTAILKWGLFRTVQEKHHVFVVAFSPNNIPSNPIRRAGGEGGIEKRTFWKTTTTESGRFLNILTFSVLGL